MGILKGLERTGLRPAMPSLEKFKSEIQHFGWSGALQVWTLTAAKRVGKLTILQCVTLPTAKPEMLQTNPAYKCGFLSLEQLEAFAANAENDLDPLFVRETIAKGDRCFGILDGDTLAAYGWYSTKTTTLDQHLTLNFDEHYVYMYKGFTHPNYRGQRLHAVGMGMALNAYLAEGSKGIVSFVEARNLSSLKSCYRLGYKDFGKVYVWETFGYPRIFHSSGCRPYGIRVSPSDPASTPASAPTKLTA
jgi:hypothetical protein